MIFQASINTRMEKVKTFFEENMKTVAEDVGKLETKWRHCLQNGTLPGHVYSTLDMIKKEMKKDAGFSMGVDSQLKTMDAMS
jgi:hypothetical protein